MPGGEGRLPLKTAAGDMDGTILEAVDMRQSRAPAAVEQSVIPAAGRQPGELVEPGELGATVAQQGQGLGTAAAQRTLGRDKTHPPLLGASKASGISQGQPGSQARGRPGGELNA